MINKIGCSALIDFGFAKEVVDKTYAFCRILEYIAPEVTLMKVYDQAVDSWFFYLSMALVDIEDKQISIMTNTMTF